MNKDKKERKGINLEWKCWVEEILTACHKYIKESENGRVERIKSDGKC